MGNSLQPYEVHPYSRPGTGSSRPEGCLRKRLLSMSKVHQKPDSLWTSKPLLGPNRASPAKTATEEAKELTVTDDGPLGGHPWEQQTIAGSWR
uniref:Uncharacterized protein n=1 Tax=Knipowitschia caucasica TaxID=637954 RepID=A0AAV2KE51_KNICA